MVRLKSLFANEKLNSKKLLKINLENLNKSKLNNKYINIVDVNYKQLKTFDKISYKSKNYINNCYQIALI